MDAVLGRHVGVVGVGWAMLAWLCWLSECLLVLVCEGLEAIATRLALCAKAILAVLAPTIELLSELRVRTSSPLHLLVGARANALEVIGVVASLWLIVDQADRVLDQMALAQLVVR